MQPLSQDRTLAQYDVQRGPGRMPRGMLKYALLFLLNERDTHGYELIAQIRARHWGAPGPGSVYPLLGTLESTGLITGHDEDGRRVYRITEAGRKTLNEHTRHLRELSATETSRDEGLTPENERMRTATSKLFHTVTHMNTESPPETLTKICDILDRARRDIYNVLAEE